jgi:hypothetical protein
MESDSHRLNGDVVARGWPLPKICNRKAAVSFLLESYYLNSGLIPQAA